MVSPIQHLSISCLRWDDKFLGASQPSNPTQDIIIMVEISRTTHISQFLIGQDSNVLSTNTRQCGTVEVARDEEAMALISPKRATKRNKAGTAFIQQHFSCHALVNTQVGWISVRVVETPAVQVPDPPTPTAAVCHLTKMVVPSAANAEGAGARTGCFPHVSEVDSPALYQCQQRSSNRSHAGAAASSLQVTPPAASAGCFAALELPQPSPLATPTVVGSHSSRSEAAETPPLCVQLAEVAQIQPHGKDLARLRDGLKASVACCPPQPSAASGGGVAVHHLVLQRTLPQLLTSSCAEDSRSFGGSLTTSNTILPDGWRAVTEPQAMPSSMHVCQPFSLLTHSKALGDPSSASAADLLSNGPPPSMHWRHRGRPQPPASDSSSSSNGSAARRARNALKATPCTGMQLNAALAIKVQRWACVSETGTGDQMGKDALWQRLQAVHGPAMR
jgi:hypothetical protein